MYLCCCLRTKYSRIPDASQSGNTVNESIKKTKNIQQNVLNNTPSSPIQTKENSSRRTQNTTTFYSSPALNNYPQQTDPVPQHPSSLRAPTATIKPLTSAGPPVF